MNASKEVRFQPASDQSLLVYFGTEISLETHLRIVKFLRLIESQPVPGIRDLHPAYNSVLIVFDPLRLRHDQLQTMLQDRLSLLPDVPLREPRVVEIPVCYGGEFGPDLEEVAHMHSMSTKEVVTLHTSPTYLVYFLGFAPGFAYLGELPGRLATPRLATPRKKVPAGSVGIAGTQTAVYPFATPGGWRLIGRTPEAMFQQNRQPMNLLSIGDKVRFVSITAEEFMRRVNR